MADKFGRRPGQPGYDAGSEAYVEGAQINGGLQPGTANGGGDPLNGWQVGSAHDLDRAGYAAGHSQGENDPRRTMQAGNQAGFGNESKFQADFNKMMFGGYLPPEDRSMPGTMYSQGPNGMQQDQSRQMQMQLMQQLQQQASGQGPSLAQMQLQKGTDQNISQAMALGASQRGAGQAGMLKGIATQQANIGQGMANDSAMMRLQEQMQARQQLGAGIQGMRGGDQARQSGLSLKLARAANLLAYDQLAAQAAKQNSIMGAASGIMGGAAGAVAISGDKGGSK